MSNYVSLLSAEYRRELKKYSKLQSIRNTVAVAAAVLLAAAAVSVGLNIAVNSSVVSVQAQNRDTQSQINKMASFEQLNQQKIELEEKIISVRSLDPGLISTVGKVGYAIPEGIWLVKLGFGDQAKKAAQVEAQARLMEVACVGNLFDDIARTIVALDKLDEIESVRCTSSSQVEGTVRFTLTVNLVSPSDK
jgi:hypothetical protein